LPANQGDCGYVPRGEGDGDGAGVAEDDREADAKGEAGRVAAGLTGSDDAPAPTAGRTLQAGRCGLAGGPGRPRASAPGAAAAWLLALTGQRATRARTV